MKKEDEIWDISGVGLRERKKTQSILELYRLYSLPGGMKLH